MTAKNQQKNPPTKTVSILGYCCSSSQNKYRYCTNHLERKKKNSSGCPKRTRRTFKLMQPFCPHSVWVWKRVGSSSIETWQDDVVKVTVKVGLAPVHRPAFSPTQDYTASGKKKQIWGEVWSGLRVLEFPPCEELKPARQRAGEELKMRAWEKREKGPEGTKYWAASLTLPISHQPSPRTYAPYPILQPPFLVAANGRAHVMSQCSWILSEPIQARYRDQKRESRLGWFKPGQRQTDMRFRHWWRDVRTRKLNPVEQTWPDFSTRMSN